MSILTSFCIDEISLASYRNCFINFRGLLLKEELAIKRGVKANAFSCLLEAMSLRFSLGRCIFEKHKIICVVWLCHSFNGISSFSCLFSVKQFSFIGFIDVRSRYFWQIINNYSTNVSSSKTPTTMTDKTVSPSCIWTIAFMFSLAHQYKSFWYCVLI